MNSTAARGRARTLWTVLLAGPVIGYSCFWIVYLAAEAGCADGIDLPGGGALRAVLLGTSAISLVAVAGYGWRAWRLWQADGAAGGAGNDDDDRRFAGFTGLVLAGLFFAFVVLLAAPIFGSTLC